MSYATPAQLAAALEIRVTAENTAQLQSCLDAAAVEIEHFLAGSTPAGTNAQALLERTNVNRAVEWFKAPATYNGGVGFVDTGVLTAPASGFERHSAALLPLKTEWGLA